MGARHLNKPVVSMASTKDGHGYWLAASDGGIFTFGDAQFYGSLGSKRLAQPIVGITATPSGKGYRMVARDGGIFDFGDAKFYGSLGGHGIADVVGMARTPSGSGYWILRKGGSRACDYLCQTHFRGSNRVSLRRCPQPRISLPAHEPKAFCVPGRCGRDPREPRHAELLDLGERGALPCRLRTKLSIATSAHAHSCRSVRSTERIAG